MAARFADKNVLRKLNNEAIARNYNRTILEAGIDSLSEDDIVAIDPIMVHEHAQGVPTTPHLRCSVYMVHPTAKTWDGLMLDVPFELFSLLPSEQDLKLDKNPA